MRKLLLIVVVLSLLVSCTSLPSSPSSPLGKAITAQQVPSWASGPGDKLFVSPDPLMPGQSQVVVSIYKEDFVWKQGYFWKGSGAWVPFIFDYPSQGVLSSSGAPTNWLRTSNKQANLTLTIDDSFGSKVLVLAYGCKLVGSSFDCNGGRWLIQSFDVVRDLDFNKDLCLAANHAWFSDATDTTKKCCGDDGSEFNISGTGTPSSACCVSPSMNVVNGVCRSCTDACTLNVQTCVGDVRQSCEMVNSCLAYVDKETCMFGCSAGVCNSNPESSQSACTSSGTSRVWINNACCGNDVSEFPTGSGANLLCCGQPGMSVDPNTLECVVIPGTNPGDVGAAEAQCGSANNSVRTTVPSDSEKCLAGTVSVQVGHGYYWTWTCTLGDSVQACTYYGLATCGAANGVEVSARPTSQLCSVGYSSAVTGTGPWSWTCSNGPSAVASCSAPLLGGGRSTGLMTADSLSGATILSSYNTISNVIHVRKGTDTDALGIGAFIGQKCLGGACTEKYVVDEYVPSPSTAGYISKYGAGVLPNHLAVLLLSNDVAYNQPSIDLKITRGDGTVSTIYLPAKTCDGAFYVGSDGSTYYTRADHGCGIQFSLSPEEALVPTHLARSSSTVSCPACTPGVSCSADSNSIQRINCVDTNSDGCMESQVTVNSCSPNYCINNGQGCGLKSIPSDVASFPGSYEVFDTAPINMICYDAKQFLEKWSSLSDGIDFSYWVATSTGDVNKAYSTPQGIYTKWAVAKSSNSQLSVNCNPNQPVYSGVGIAWQQDYNLPARNYAISAVANIASPPIGDMYRTGACQSASQMSATTLRINFFNAPPELVYNAQGAQNLFRYLCKVSS